MRITYAPHLRGFVNVEPDWRGIYNGKAVCYWGVWNTRTEEVITSDNTCCTLDEAISHAERLVGAARIAWMCSFKLEELI